MQFQTGVQGNSSGDLEELLSLVEELRDLVEQHYGEVPDRDATLRDLYLLHTQLRDDEPNPVVVTRALKRIMRFLIVARDILPDPRLDEACDLFGSLLSIFLRLTPDELVDGMPGLAAGTYGGLTTRSQPPEMVPLPVTIYLSDEDACHEVEGAVEDLLETAGLAVLDREDPVVGSWFRRMWATVSRAAQSQVVRESALTAAHVADTRLILAQDATITATMMQNVGPVLASLQPTKDAVVRLGAVLIVKVDWEVRVIQLTAAQQAVLDHRPQLATSPRDVIGAIGLLASSEGRAAAEPAPQAAGD
jgi:hypothetical protein